MRSKLPVLKNLPQVTSFGPPSAVFVELTQDCGLVCAMCGRDENLSFARNRMSESTFSRTESELFSEAKFVDLRGWGESINLPEFPDRAARVVQSGAVLRLITSMCFYSAGGFQALAESNAVVGVSLDSVDPEVYKLVRGGANLSKTKHNLRKLRAAYESTGADWNRVYFTTTVFPETVPALADLVQYAVDEGISEVRLFPVKGRTAIGLDTVSYAARLRQQLKRILQIQSVSKIDVNIGAKLCPAMRLLRTREKQTCIHPWEYVVVYYNGDVGFCDFLMGPSAEKYVLGNINDDSIEDIFNSRRWNELRRRHLKGDLDDWCVSGSCSWCYENRFIDHEYIVDTNLGEQIVSISDVAID